MSARDSASSESRLKRLRWRCRRGTRELDALLGGWLDVHATGADGATIDAFDRLLDQTDPDLWDWLTGHSSPPRAEWGAIVAQIRSSTSMEA